MHIISRINSNNNPATAQRSVSFANRSNQRQWYISWGSGASYGETR